MFALNNLLKSLQNVSKLKIIHPVGLKDVVLRLDESDGMVDLVICFRETMVRRQ